MWIPKWGLQKINILFDETVKACHWLFVCEKWTMCILRGILWITEGLFSALVFTPVDDFDLNFTWKAEKQATYISTRGIDILIGCLRYLNQNFHLKLTCNGNKIAYFNKFNWNWIKNWYHKGTSIWQAPVFRQPRSITEKPMEVLLSGWMNYNYTACCWFPTSSNILILPSQLWQIRFESCWLHCSNWYDVLQLALLTRC